MQAFTVRREIFCNWKLKQASSIFRAAALMATRSRPAATYFVAPERIAIRYSNSLLIIIKKCSLQRLTL